MSIHKIHLRALLELFYLKENKVTSRIRRDVLNHLNRANGSKGGDFHTPFWSDVKHHLAGDSDLAEMTISRVEVNSRRKRLYPLLSKKFFEWWGEKKRWTNAGFSLLPSSKCKGRYEIPDLDAAIKVENILALAIGNQPPRYFYPYFSEKTILTEDAARIGLWVMQKALPDIPPDRLRILDLLRAKSYSLKKVPLKGNEDSILKYKYKNILEEWDKFYQEGTGR